jgi:endonuclease/exonuclease/phosphatase family metal-dependent hydrolase
VTGDLRIASANLEFGGMRNGGWERSRARLREWDPHVILLQEVCMWPASRTGARLREMAAELGGMTPVLGQPMPRSASANHPAILVRAGITVLEEGAEYPPGDVPAWCEAVIAVPGLPEPVRVISVHLTPWSGVDQLAQAQRLACRIAQARDRYVIAGGDLNSYGRGEELDPELLAAQPRHLRMARMRRDGSGGWVPNYDVSDTLEDAGLADVAVVAGPERRTPRDLTPTGVNGGGRVDQVRVSEDVAAAVISYEQRDTGGSDHDAILATFGLEAMASVTPAGPGQ